MVDQELLDSWIQEQLTITLQNKDHAAHLLEQLTATGLQEQLLKKSLAARLERDDVSTETVLDTYALLEKHATSTLDLSSYCSSRRRGQYTCSAITPCDSEPYGLVAGWDGREHNGKRYYIHIDTPFAFCLFHKETPQAVIAFDISSRHVLKVYQLQGVMPFREENRKLIPDGHARGLFGIDWTRGLVEELGRWGKEHGFIKYGVQGGNNNDYQDTIVDGQYISLGKLLERYDATAERLGFVQEGDSDWYKAL
ncbi:MAG: hypothetical protein V1725_05935 [archaeon]